MPPYRDESRSATIHPPRPASGWSSTNHGAAWVVCGHLAAEWHPTANELRPDQVTRASGLVSRIEWARR
jgi:hypothetical protein